MMHWLEKDKFIRDLAAAARSVALDLVDDTDVGGDLHEAESHLDYYAEKIRAKMKRVVDAYLS